MYNREKNESVDVLMFYLESFYWSTLTLSLVGDLPRPRNKSEFFYVIFQLMLGLLLFATVLGHVANIVTNVSAARKEFQGKIYVLIFILITKIKSRQDIMLEQFIWTKTESFTLIACTYFVCGERKGVYIKLPIHILSSMLFS